MNRGHAADTLFIRADGRYRRVYRMPGQAVVTDNGTWARDTLHGDVVFTFTPFWAHWRGETDPSSLPRRPVIPESWTARPTRTFTGRLQLVVDEDLEWSYLRR
jgi:hypothetical protein